MKPTQRELTEWVINKIKRDYKEDIGLLIAIEGHSLPSDCHGECFDYFIPVTERGNELGMTFIIDGVGHDLYPRSWQRIENMAEFDDNFHYGLGNGIVLYYRNEEDLKKFEDYRKLLLDHLQDEDYMYRKALEKLDTAMDIYRTLMFEEKLSQVRMGAGYIAYYLSLSVAFMNKRYYKERLDLPIVELKKMEKCPKDFILLYEGIVEALSVEKLKSLSHQIILTTRSFMEENKVVKHICTDEINYNNLKEWYQEGSLTFRRIYIHCDEGNYSRVFGDALTLQNEFNIIKEEFGLKEMDLMGVFNVHDLGPLKARAREIEDYIVDTVISHGITLNQYDTVEAFIRENS